MASNGQRGATFERQCRTALETAGYVVIRSAASKTGVDLVALRRSGWVEHRGLLRLAPRAMLVQAKTNGRLDKEEWDALLDLATAAGVSAVLARREKVDGRLRPIFYTLDAPKVPYARTQPATKIVLPEMPDEQAV